jgi:hypothetical protein
MRAGVVSHPPGQLGEFSTDGGEPGTGLGIEAAVGEQRRHLGIQVVHNRTADPAAAEPVIQRATEL